MVIEKIGLKEDKGKLRLDLIPPFALKELARVLEYGAKKYKANSWQNVENPFDVRYASILRHLLAWRDGEILDKESGLPHLSHAFSNLMFLIYHQERLK